MKKIATLILITILVSCSADKTEQKETKRIDFNGTWTNVNLAVTIQNDNGDSTVIVNEGEWEKVLGIKPILTTFSADSSFISKYYSLNNDLMFTSSGKWWVEKDTLVMISESAKNKYAFESNEKGVKFSGMLDWDQDGLIDDYYEGVQIKLDSLPNS